MKESLWGYYLVLLGIGVSTFMVMITNMTTTNQQDYYLLKEVTNAAMIDAIDLSYYDMYGQTRINTEKFVENFIRRFSEVISKTNTYKIDFYSIYEDPPSVSIKVTSNTGDFHIAGDSTNIDVINTIDAVLEVNNTPTVSSVFYSIPYGNCEESSYIDKNYKYCNLSNKVKLSLNSSSSYMNELKDKVIKQNKSFDIKKVKVLSVDYLSLMKTDDDLKQYSDNYQNMYNRFHSANDVPQELLDSRYLATDVKNVRLTLKNKGDDYYFAYGLDFTCKNVKRFGIDDNSVIKKYRKKPEKTSNLEMSEYLTYSSNYSLDTSYTNDEIDGYELTPYYGNCIIGIKYKVNFYYDDK